MKSLYIVTALLFISADGFSQDNKIIPGHVGFFTVGDGYVSGAYSYLPSKRVNYTFTLSYLKGQEKSFKHESVTFHANFGYTLFRLGDAYFNAGAGGFAGRARNQDNISNQDSETNTGVFLNTELEYFISWRVIASFEAKGMGFIKSNYFDARLVVSLGLKYTF